MVDQTLVVIKKSFKFIVVWILVYSNVISRPKLNILYLNQFLSKI